jgi:SAM-dependent methyltransferase
LSHYFPANHEIVDKYEKGDGIVNEDIVDFRPGKKYDLIISISTLEHIGWDEEIKEPEKIPRALAHMQELLAPGGTLAVSMPLGYNPHLDELLESGDFPLGKRFYFKKTSRLIWLEASWEEVCGAKWDEPFEGANGLVFATWEKPRQ